jgi:hypothetical protein
MFAHIRVECKRAPIHFAPRQAYNGHRRARIVPARITEENVMPKYLIERDIPGAGKSSRDDLKGISRKSCDVLAGMGPHIQWQQSYVTGDKVYCVYIAENEQLVRDHAQRAGIPANRVSEIVAVIDPATAE